MDAKSPMLIIENNVSREFSNNIGGSNSIAIHKSITKYSYETAIDSSGSEDDFQESQIADLGSNSNTNTITANISVFKTSSSELFPTSASNLGTLSRYLPQRYTTNINFKKRLGQNATMHLASYPCTCEQVPCGRCRTGCLGNADGCPPGSSRNGCPCVFTDCGDPYASCGLSPTFRPSSQPSCQPTNLPGVRPTMQPSLQPSRQPSLQPSNQPSSQPSFQPSVQPSHQPSSHPTIQPTSQPSSQPITQPSRLPTIQPSKQPTIHPSSQPFSRPSSQPSKQPTRQPSLKPSCQPSRQPSSYPSRQPSSYPSRQPSSQPSMQPTRQPSLKPSCQPSCQPSRQPSSRPSRQPTQQPTTQPSMQPNVMPSSQPSIQPSRLPSSKPSSQPSYQPSRRPTQQPSSKPSCQPTHLPSIRPSKLPSSQPSNQPSPQPFRQPTSQPTYQPLSHPSSRPSRQPLSVPSMQPSAVPSNQPSMHPSEQPSSCPSTQPSRLPSQQPTKHPSSQPSSSPSNPSSQPSRQPSSQPSRQPSYHPSSQPSCNPTRQPSSQPSVKPHIIPSAQPSSQPSSCPSWQPSLQPSCQPSANPSQPSSQPSKAPSSKPSSQPLSHPSISPSREPSKQPSSQPSSQPCQTPTSRPSKQPTLQPFQQPSSQPSLLPSNQPTSYPSNPSSQPSIQPSYQPSSAPSDFPDIWIVNVTRFDDDYFDPRASSDIRTVDFDLYCTNENWRTTSSTNNCTLRLAIYYCLFRFPWSSNNNNDYPFSSSRCNIVFPPHTLIRFNKSFTFTESRFQDKHQIRISFIFQQSVYLLTNFLQFDFGMKGNSIVSLTFENAYFQLDFAKSSSHSRSTFTNNLSSSSSDAPVAAFQLANLESIGFIDVVLEQVSLAMLNMNKVVISNASVSNHITSNVHHLRDVYALSVQNVSFLDIVNSSFDSNTAGALLVDNCLFLTVRGCYFTNNTAAFGSAMYLSKVRTSVIASSSFIANIAYQAGTVYWLFDTTSIKQISSSSALSSPPNVTSDNIWIDNYARYYGNKTASSFCGNNCLRFSPDAIQVNDYSNISLPSQITVDIVDYYGSIISYYNGNRVSLSANQKLSNCGGLLGSDQVIRHDAAVVDKANNLNYMSFYLKNGSTVFSNVGVSCLPSGYMSLEFAVLLRAPYDEFKYRVDVYSNNLPITFRNCIKGEIFDLMSVTQSTCSKCLNSYSFNANSNFDSVSTTCTACPAEALLCEGDQIYLKPGTWRPNADTTTIFTCQSIYACIGGNTSGTSGCNTGYNGPLCGVCAKNYYLSDLKQCETCQIDIKPILQSFGYLLGLCICIAGATKVLKNKFHIDINEYLNDDFFTSIVSGVISSYQIILLGMGSTSFFKSLSSFSKLAGIFKILSLNLASMLSLPCFFDYNYYSSLRFTLLLPFSICALLAVMAISSRSAEARNRYYTILINVLCFFIPISSSASFQFFQCADGGGSDYFLVSDLSIKCSGALYEYYKIWAVAGVIVYSSGIPLLFLILLYNRQRLIARKVVIDNYRSVLSHAEFAHMKFSLYYELLPPLDGLYLRSKAEYWWFNTFNIIVSIFLTSVVTFLFEEDNIQLLISIVVLLFSYRLQIQRKPYSYDLDNRFSIWSTFQLVLLYISLYVRANLGLGLDGKKYEILDMLMVALNLFVILLAIYYLYMHFKDEEETKKRREKKLMTTNNSKRSPSAFNDIDNLGIAKEDQEKVDGFYKPFGVELDYMSFGDLRGVGTRELLTVMGVLYLRLAPRGTYTNLKKKYRDVGSIVDSLHATYALPSLYFIRNYDDEDGLGDVENSDERIRLCAVTIFSQSRRPDENMAQLICRGGGGISSIFSVFVNLGRYISIKYHALNAKSKVSPGLLFSFGQQSKGPLQQQSMQQSKSNLDQAGHLLLLSSVNTILHDQRRIMDDLMRDLESSQPLVQALLGEMNAEELYSNCMEEFLLNPDHWIDDRNINSIGVMKDDRPSVIVVDADNFDITVEKDSLKSVHHHVAHLPTIDNCTDYDIDIDVDDVNDDKCDNVNIGSDGSDDENSLFNPDLGNYSYDYGVGGGGVLKYIAHAHDLQHITAAVLPSSSTRVQTRDHAEEDNFSSESGSEEGVEGRD